MTSLQPQIEILQEVPFANLNYASSLLDLILNKLATEMKLEIGVFEDRDGLGSAIGFDSDESEDVQLYLRYVKGRFVILLHENSEENCAAVFKYTIYEESSLYKRLPTLLCELMEKVSNTENPMTYKAEASKLNQKK